MLVALPSTQYKTYSIRPKCLTSIAVRERLRQTSVESELGTYLDLAVGGGVENLEVSSRGRGAWSTPSPPPMATVQAAIHLFTLHYFSTSSSSSSSSTGRLIAPPIGRQGHLLLALPLAVPVHLQPASSRGGNSICGPR